MSELTMIELCHKIRELAAHAKLCRDIFDIAKKHNEGVCVLLADAVDCMNAYDELCKAQDELTARLAGKAEGGAE